MPDARNALSIWKWAANSRIFDVLLPGKSTISVGGIRQVFEQLFEFIFGRCSVQEMHFVAVR